MVLVVRRTRCHVFMNCSMKQLSPLVLFFNKRLRLVDFVEGLQMGFKAPKPRVLSRIQTLAFWHPNV
jgi:hypothetical protein